MLLNDTHTAQEVGDEPCSILKNLRKYLWQLMPTESLGFQD